MANKRAYVMISLSLVMGMVAAWMASNWIQGTVEGQNAEMEMASVIAADLAIPFGTKVESRHLKVLEMPAEYVPAGSFSSVEEVVDRVTVQPIVAGEILMSARFVNADDGSTLAPLITEKMRAVTVRVDDVIGVAGFLLPGNKVDVLSSRLEQNQRAVSETILRNIKVLAVDQTAAAEKNEPVIVRAVTLEVSPDDAEILVKSREEGSIQLTLRNPLDDEEEVVAEETPPPAPVAAPAPQPVAAPAPRRVAPAPSRAFPVTIIRGTSVSETKAST
ncbi:MAG: Flp pilus assembly protein CpaB [Gammaproteobacteria bacterium]|jgi:pilus assembly protein CpaB